MAEIKSAYFPGATDKAPILMLHGTGGDEADLLPLATFLASDSPKLGIRGRVNEGGANRYFRHNATGGFDLTNLSEETDWLLEAIEIEADKHNLNPAQMVVLGFSNGANVAAYAWLHKQPTFKTAVLLHPMQLDPAAVDTKLTDVAAFASHGEVDPIVPAANFKALTEQLKEAGVALETHEGPQSHQLSREELTAAKKWLLASGRLSLA